MYSQVLDDQTFAALQSVMLMNNVEILFKLQQDPNFFPDLFKKLKTTPPIVCDLPLHADMVQACECLGTLSWCHVLEFLA